MAKAKNDSVKLAKRAEKSKAKQVAKLKTGLPARDVKLDAFLEEFMHNGGNATKAALVVFQPANVEAAAVMGHRYREKAKMLAGAYLEKQGFGYGKFLDVAAEKMLESKNPDWWDRLMKIAGYDNFIDKKSGQPQAVVNVFQLQKKMQNQYGFGDEEEVINGEES